MALLCNKIDLDLEDPSEVYENAEETIKYLQDVMSSLEKRVLDGEQIPGFAIAPGRKSRSITKAGLDLLEKNFGHDVIYKTIEKPITLTEIDKLVSKEDMAHLISKGYIEFKESSPKVVVSKLVTNREDDENGL